MHTQVTNFNEIYEHVLIKSLKSFSYGVEGYTYRQLILTDGASFFFRRLNFFKIVDEVNAVLPELALTQLNHFVIRLKFNNNGMVTLSVIGLDKPIVRKVDMTSHHYFRRKSFKFFLCRYKRLGFVLTLPSEL